jgi:intergrase/recombinase
MNSDLLRALFALAAFGLPLGVAWFIVGRSESARHRRRKD